MTIDAMLAQMSVWQRFWEFSFYQNALAGGAAIALLCSVLSVFVVLKRVAFIGEGIAHGAFGGVGVALLAGLFLEELRPPLARDAIIALFCIASALAIGYISRRGKLAEDSAIGICLVAAMAIGLLLLDARVEIIKRLIDAGAATRSQIGFTPSSHDILFGDPLSIRPREVAVLWALTGVIVLSMAAVFKELVFFAFDEETAAVFGVRTNVLYYALLVALALAVVAAMRSLGIILVSALLIIPGASARLWSCRIGVVTIISAVIGLAGMIGGLFLAIWLDFLSPGAVIVLVLVALLVLSYAVTSFIRRRRNSKRLTTEHAKGMQQQNSPQSTQRTQRKA